MNNPLPNINKNLLMESENKRKVANKNLNLNKKINLAQYMTPLNIATFMAELFPKPVNRNIKLLDPGAGVGSLTTAFFNHFKKKFPDKNIESTTYEIDPIMQRYLKENLILCEKTSKQYKSKFNYNIIDKDFILDASEKISSMNSIFKEKIDFFTHCIMNPPYKKISSTSNHRIKLRTAGIETVNLYTAFIALSILLLEKKGFLVAIIPRSFCNGPYYLPFRKLLLKHCAIRHIHLFKSRTSAFKEDKVLQENIIIALEKESKQDRVKISTSTDDTFSDFTAKEYDFNYIVKQHDKELFIHIPTSNDNYSDLTKHFNKKLTDIGINISTGPVVNHKLKEYLRNMPEEDSVPLLQTCNFKKNVLVWPIKNGKKPNAILENDFTKKWLYPKGFYTITRRFSSKEEKKRIVANIIDPKSLNEFNKIGIENHLNVFHENKRPLSENLAKGLFIYLNSTIVDKYFRSFSGHTQVNATDLKQMAYPDRKTLINLGKWFSKQKVFTQETIDKKMESLL